VSLKIPPLERPEAITPFIRFHQNQLAKAIRNKKQAVESVKSYRKRLGQALDKLTDFESHGFVKGDQEHDQAAGQVSLWQNAIKIGELNIGACGVPIKISRSNLATYQKRLAKAGFDMITETDSGSIQVNGSEG
jgi:hypothetical protein